MSPPRRGVYWQAEEVTILLRTVRDRGYAWLLMASTGLPNRRAFRAVARAIQLAGFHRMEVQACTKWKALKRDFFSAMEAYGGHPRHSAWPPHFAVMRQLWRLAGEPRWVDRRPEGAAARRRALAPPRERLEGPVQGQEGETSSGGDSVSPAEERGEAAAPHQSSSASMEELPAEPSHEAGPSGMAAPGHQPQQQHCNCFHLRKAIWFAITSPATSASALQLHPCACFPSLVMWPLAPGIVWAVAIRMGDMNLGEVLEQPGIAGVQEQDEVQVAMDTFMAHSGQLMSLMWGRLHRLSVGGAVT
uniref:Uncharacterized protein n=1 Tax=Sphaerodactylus townsendi TaxID=933632 RepID=A0ACB8EU04_9SAUR